MMQIKRRGMLQRWFQRWIYTLVCEQAAIQGQAALWMPTQPCIICEAHMVQGCRFCPYCGALQVVEPDGPETEPRYFVWIDGQPQRMRLDGRSPNQAYRDLARKVRQET
jgi:hypothetical protein